MVRIRTGWVVALAALGLCASACKKNDDKGSGSGDTKTAEGKPAGGGTSAMGGASGGAAVANDDLALLPVDSEVVFGINFGQLQQSGLWKEFVAPKLSSTDMAGIQKFKAICGFDPMESLKGIAVGVKGWGGSEPTGVAVVHGFDKSKSMTCFDKDGVDEAQKDGSKVTIDGDVVMVADKSGKPWGFTFVNDSTAIAVYGPDATTKDGIKKIAAGGGSLAKSQTVVDLYGKIKTADSVWFLVNGNAPFMSKMGSLGVKPKAVFGSVNVTDGLALDLHVRLSTPDEAGNLVSMIKGQAAQAKQFFDKFDASNDAADVLIGIAMSKEKLKTLAGMLGGMMGGMMGGGMGGGMGGPPGGGM